MNFVMKATGTCTVIKEIFCHCKPNNIIHVFQILNLGRICRDCYMYVYVFQILNVCQKPRDVWPTCLFLSEMTIQTLHIAFCLKAFEAGHVKFIMYVQIIVQNNQKQKKSDCTIAGNKCTEKSQQFTKRDQPSAVGRRTSRPCHCSLHVTSFLLRSKQSEGSSQPRWRPCRSGSCSTPSTAGSEEF